MMIDLSEKECLIFRRLAEANALDIVDGSVQINFDWEGKPASIDVRRHTKFFKHKDSLSTGSSSIDFQIVV